MVAQAAQVKSVLGESTFFHDAGAACDLAKCVGVVVMVTGVVLQVNVPGGLEAGFRLSCITAP